jgi:hypothetical protein
MACQVGLVEWKDKEGYLYGWAWEGRYKEIVARYVLLEDG